MASSPCGCWCRPSRRSRHPQQEEDASRFVAWRAWCFSAVNFGTVLVQRRVAESRNYSLADGPSLFFIPSMSCEAVANRRPCPRCDGWSRRGVSRKARQHIIKIRMPGSPARVPTNTAAQTPNTTNNVDSTTAAAVGSAGTSGAAAAAAAAAAEAEEASAAEPPAEGARQDTDYADAAIAVKVRLHSFPTSTPHTIPHSRSCSSFVFFFF